MRLHVVGLPHTETIADEFSWCAYTTKVRRFCGMMKSLGHEVILYAGERNEADVDEHVVCITREEQARMFTATIPEFDPEAAGWKFFNRAVSIAVHERAEPGDFLCLITGRTAAMIAEENPALVPVEFGVGYEGIHFPFRVFESYAWMHAVYGGRFGAYNADGAYYDAVIPNYFDLDDFPVGDGGGDYLFFIGRMIRRKGLATVRDIQKRTGLKLITAGEGPQMDLLDGAEYEHVGSVGPEQRAELMGGARAVLVPTHYIEPFGGVAVEAQLCGTPVLTTDWGAFTETVKPGVTGYRCRTLAQFALAAEEVLDLDRAAIRSHAEQYDMHKIKHEYDAYFERLDQLKGQGWYS